MSSTSVLVTSLLFTVCYAGLLIWSQKRKLASRLSDKSLRLIKVFHYLFTILLLALILISLSQLIVRKGWTAIIVSGFILTGLSIYPFAGKEQLAKIEKIYFKSLSWLWLVLACFVWIPFIGWSLLFNFMDLFHSHEQYFDDVHIKIVESSLGGFMAPKGVDILNKKGIFEELLFRGYISHTFDSTIVHYDIDSTRIYFFTPSFRNSTKDDITIISVKRVD